MRSSSRGWVVHSCQAQPLGSRAPGYKLTGHHLGDPRGLRHHQQSGNRDLAHGQHPGLDGPDCRPPETGYFPQHRQRGRARECGRGEHLGRYEHVAKARNDAGGSASALDHVGHGRSEGERVVSSDFAPVVEDVHTVVGQAKAANPGLPVAMIGDSMGGMIAARYAQLHPGELAALVLSGPVIGTLKGITTLLGMDVIPSDPIDPAFCPGTRRSGGPTARTPDEVLADTTASLAKVTDVDRTLSGRHPTGYATSRAAWPGFRDPGSGGPPDRGRPYRGPPRPAPLAGGPCQHR
jgi:pimeloyl-ACP methyl ester carboxylesterase